MYPNIFKIRTVVLSTKLLYTYTCINRSLLSGMHIWLDLRMSFVVAQLYKYNHCSQLMCLFKVAIVICIYMLVCIEFSIFVGIILSIIAIGELKKNSRKNSLKI